MKRIDSAALTACLALARADRDIAPMLAGRPRKEERAVACYHLQLRSLNLRPWQEPPCVADEDGLDRDGGAQRLLRKMIAGGVSRYAADPLAALAAKS